MAHIDGNDFLQYTIDVSRRNRTKLRLSRLGLECGSASFIYDRDFMHIQTLAVRSVLQYDDGHKAIFCLSFNRRGLAFLAKRICDASYKIAVFGDVFFRTCTYPAA